MKKILINYSPWQTRIAITNDDRLQNIYFASHAVNTLERVYFKGIVTKVLPGIQTAFVDIGQERAGFLHISEIDRELAIERISASNQLDDDEGAPKKPSRSRGAVDISKILKEGEAILVQVSKEPVYEKGAKLTTCFTLPGRFIVLMPNIPRIGVSKKIETHEERQRLKEIVGKHLPEGMGAIIRTTSEDRPESEIQQDITFLVKTWRAIEKQFATAKPKEKIHEDIDLTLQVVRDNLDNDVEAVITDDKENQKKIHQYVKDIAPEHSQKIRLYKEPINIFQHYGVEKQLMNALNKKVELRSGGSLIIETTEAMTVIDVNTGKFVGKTNLEDTIFKTNMEAAEETARQLRLRNIGGLIVIDFIDMATAANRQKLSRFFEKILKEQDKFQSVLLKISEFGLVQMTRKRSGKTLAQQLTEDCPSCHGIGFIKSLQAECFALLRKFKQDLAEVKSDSEIILQINPEVFAYITNTEYNAILLLEKEFKVTITLSSNKNLPIAQYKLEQVTL